MEKQRHGCLTAANVVCAIALFQWRKWGFYGFVATSVVGLVVNLAIGLNPVQALLGLVGIAILYGVLQIGGTGRAGRSSFSSVTMASKSGESLIRLVRKAANSTARAPGAVQRGLLRPLRVLADVLVYSEEQVDEWGSIPGTVLFEALNEGRVLYAAAWRGRPGRAATP
ncbi:MAG: hypothetical protein ACRDRP_21075 [Pseudonocardiaceae bacterium]